MPEKVNPIQEEDWLTINLFAFEKMFAKAKKAAKLAQLPWLQLNTADSVSDVIYDAGDFFLRRIVKLNAEGPWLLRGNNCDIICKCIYKVRVTTTVDLEDLILPAGLYAKTTDTRIEINEKAKCYTDQPTESGGVEKRIFARRIDSETQSSTAGTTDTSKVSGFSETSSSSSTQKEDKATGKAGKATGKAGKAPPNQGVTANKNRTSSIVGGAKNPGRSTTKERPTMHIRKGLVKVDKNNHRETQVRYWEEYERNWNRNNYM